MTSWAAVQKRRSGHRPARHHPPGPHRRPRLLRGAAIGSAPSTSPRPRRRPGHRRTERGAAPPLKPEQGAPVLDELQASRWSRCCGRALRRLPPRSTLRRTQSSKTTSCSRAPRRLTTRRSTAPKASTPARTQESTVTSIQSLSASEVPTRRSPWSHTSFRRARRRRSPLKAVSMTAHSRNRAPPASGSSKVSPSKWTVS